MLCMAGLIAYMLSVGALLALYAVMSFLGFLLDCGMTVVFTFAGLSLPFFVIVGIVDIIIDTEATGIPRHVAQKRLHDNIAKFWDAFDYTLKLIIER